MEVWKEAKRPVCSDRVRVRERGTEVVQRESSKMCGCAVELNMNSFIRARQKDTPNTDEAQARIHTNLTHTHS